MEPNPRSRDALLEFLDYLSRKGMLNKTTAGARKAAAAKVLALLDEDEAADISNLDVDQLMLRFSNKYGSEYTPGSLNTYKSRVKSSVDDFLNYQQNPMTFKVGGSGGGRKVGERSRSAAPASEKVAQRVAIPPIAPPPASVSVLPIPIRADLIVQIQGLPFDLTSAEANKIANVIKAMALS